jgi:hypothetical protein
LAILQENEVDRNSWGSFFLVGLSAIVCVASIEMGIGTLGNPRSGFMPFMAALFFGLLSLVQLGKDFFGKRSRSDVIHIKTGKVEREGENKKGIILVMIVLSIYVIIMPRIGYLISTLLLMICLLRIGSAMKWRFVIGGSLVITLFSYLIFDRLLSCQFPAGLLEYWR